MLDKLIDILLQIWDSFKPVIFVLEYKQGALFRAGKFKKILYPGWHLRIPFVDDYHTENVMFDTMCIKEVSVTTLDGKTISVGGEFDLNIVNYYKASVLTNDWRTNIVDIVRGIISDELEGRNWDDIRKKTTKNAIEKEIHKRGAEMGIEISNFNFTDKSISRVFKLFNA